ncbi:DNA-binding protein [Roseovarius sp. D0-M9]|uniref:DNA-binding protein n=1 Tax=Roseovarius sp. D0-M9 TaxID=3127117 RepID=UPI00300FAB54
MSTTHPDPIMVRVSNAKAAFGVHRATLYRWAADNHITIHKRGTMSFVDPVQVRNFIMGLGERMGEQKTLRPK